MHLSISADDFFGISNLSHQLRDVPHICKEAVDALHSGHLSGSTEFIQTYHMKDVSELCA
ncbi:hypothetical protein PO124_07290 [Bacillus licheniformis]|nr:hypothetical protein [Bacillus licheniformis]